MVQSLWRHFLRAVSLAAAIGGTAVLAAERTGQQLYVEHCAKCHGKAGEGSEEDYPERLVGELSVGELAGLIDKTMPYQHPEKIGPEESLLVSAYIHDAFYSPLAQERNRPARVELSRLTVRQFQNSVSDLVASFRKPATVDRRRGLAAEYYKGRRIRPDDKVEERIDGQVNFDFGTASPLPGKTEDYEFSIHWEGALYAPDSGDYEFIVRTQHACRLWVNDLEQPLIDAWVKSGNDTEYKASLRLLGGRMYALQLEFSKAKQGVDDSKKQKSTPQSKPAAIQLCWRPPHGTTEPIPARCLSPSKVSERFVLLAPFPPDDRSVGYERGNAISRTWDNATTTAALETAEYVAAHRVELAGVRQARRTVTNSPSFRNMRRGESEQVTPDSDEERRNRLRQFCYQLVERAFRQPLGATEREFFVDRQWAATPDEETAIKRVVILMLKSPRFLYRELPDDDSASTSNHPVASGRPLQGESPYVIASRLSFGLWDSLPDQPLLEAAASDQLHSREQVAAQAQRMLADPRTHTKLREFLLQWLKVDQPPEIAKDKERFPEFSEEVAADLRTSLDLFLEDVLTSEHCDFRELLTADWLYLNGRLAKLYRPDLPEDAPFLKAALDRGERTGVLTHPYLMAGFAYTATSSPIHRGVFIARSVLGRSLRPPPMAVSPLPVELHADLTTRERITLQTKPEACQSCHTMINPLGFTLENFDAVGRFRTLDDGKPIDPSGLYRQRNGQVVKFDGVRDLADFLAASEETRSAFAEQLFHHMIKQPIRAYGLNALSELRQSFAEKDFNIRQLAAEIATKVATPPEPHGDARN